MNTIEFENRPQDGQEFIVPPQGVADQDFCDFIVTAQKGFVKDNDGNVFVRATFRNNLSLLYPDHKEEDEEKYIQNSLEAINKLKKAQIIEDVIKGEGHGGIVKVSNDQMLATISFIYVLEKFCADKKGSGRTSDGIFVAGQLWGENTMSKTFLDSWEKIDLEKKSDTDDMHDAADMILYKIPKEPKDLDQYDIDRLWEVSDSLYNRPIGGMIDACDEGQLVRYGITFDVMKSLIFIYRAHKNDLLNFDPYSPEIAPQELSDSLDYVIDYIDKFSKRYRNNDQYKDIKINLHNIYEISKRLVERNTFNNSAK